MSARRTLRVDEDACLADVAMMTLAKKALDALAKTTQKKLTRGGP